MLRFSPITVVLSAGVLLHSIRVAGADDISLDRLAAAETAAAEYFQGSPVGRVHAEVWMSLPQIRDPQLSEMLTTVRSHFDGHSLYLELDRLFGKDRVRSSGWPRARKSMIHEGKLTTWFTKSGAVLVRGLDKYPGNPFDNESIFYPRFLGTALVDSVLEMPSRSPKGLLADNSLEAKSAKLEPLDKTQCIVGTYKNNENKTVRLWWSSDLPVRLLKSEVAVRSRAINHVHTVTIEYRTWPCGVVFPERIVSTDVANDRLQSREEITVKAYEAPNISELDFTLTALDIPDGYPVYFREDDFSQRRTKWDNGTVREYTDEEHAALEARVESMAEKRDRDKMLASPSSDNHSGLFRLTMLFFPVVLLILVVWFSFRNRSDSESSAA